MDELNPADLAASKPFSLKAATKPAPPKTLQVDLPELLTDINQIDHKRELAMQYSLAKQAYALVQHDSETPLNQKAQALNTITNILASIVKLQDTVYSIERMKILEEALIESLQSFPDLKQAFLDKYKQRLEQL